MKKIFMTLLLAVAAVGGANAQLLYKISGNDLEKPSYIIGTHHLANVMMVNSITGVKTAIIETDQVYGEVNMDDMQKTDTLKMVEKAQKLPNGKSLKDVLTAEQYKKVDAYLKKLMSVGFSSPEVMQKMGHLTPLALTAQLQVLLFTVNHMGEYDSSSTFDMYFQAQAKKNNEPIGGLETVAQQVETLYGSMPMERQIEELMCFIDNEKFNADMMDAISDAFYDQDLEAVYKAMNDKLNSKCDATAEETARLIDNRNADWAAKMPAIMAAKPTLFAVGAGHLAGDKGVLQLLRNAGYTVEGVK